MKIFIDSSKLYNTTIDNFSFPFNNDLHEKLINELQFSNPTCYLVSGYRGVGKTSFIKSLKSKLENKKLFVHINVGKYEKFSNVLRNMIRSIYWELDEKNLLICVKEKNPVLLEEIKIIYDRTFNNIEFKNNTLFLNEKWISKGIKFDFTNLIIRLVAIGLGITAILEFIKSGNYLVYIILTLLCALFIWRFEYNKTKKNSESLEINRVTFFDDEIAEFQLNRIIKKLKSVGIEIIFVIDELDKIEDEKQIDSLIHELKPLMFESESNFILISGQKLFYKYQYADTKDDSVLSSLFSKVIHVPLLANEKFHDYFDSIKKTVEGTNEEVNEGILNSYIESNILQSHRVFRKFINLLQHDVNFTKDGNAYIEVSDKKIDTLKTNSEISKILRNVEIVKIQSEDFEDGIKDFLISNLYISIKNMKRFKFPFYFEIEDILKSKDLKGNKYIEHYIDYIRDSLQKLIDEMTEKELLDVKETEGVIKYRWNESVKFEEQFNPLGYLNEYIKFEKWIKDIINELNYNNYLEIDKKGFYNSSLVRNLDILVENKIIPDSMISEIKELSNVRNKIMHGEELDSASNLNLITFYQKLLMSKNAIFNYTMEYITINVNGNKNYIRNKDLNFSFDLTIGQTIFDFKHFKNKKGLLKVINNFRGFDILLNTNYKEVKRVFYFEGDKDSIKKLQSIANKQFYDGRDIKVLIVNSININELKEFLLISPN